MANLTVDADFPGVSFGPSSPTKGFERFAERDHRNRITENFVKRKFRRKEVSTALLTLKLQTRISTRLTHAFIVVMDRIVRLLPTRKI